MISSQEKHVFLCSRLQRLGYGSGRRLRLYGEEFELITDPIPEGNGYSVDGISRKSGLRHVQIPVSVTHTIEREFVVLQGKAVPPIAHKHAA